MTEGLHTFAILSDSYLAGRRALKEPTSLRKSALCDVKNILQAKQTPNLPMKRLITTSKELTPCPKQRASDSTSLSSTILPDSPSQHDHCNCVDYEEYSVGIIRLESDCLRGQDIVCVKEGIFKVPNSEDSAPTCPQFPELEFSDADESFSFPATSLDSYFFPVVVSLDDQYTFDFDDFEE